MESEIKSEIRSVRVNNCIEKDNKETDVRCRELSNGDVENCANDRIGTINIKNSS